MGNKKFGVQVLCEDSEGIRSYSVKIKRNGKEKLGANLVIEALLSGAVIVARGHNILDELPERLRLLSKAKFDSPN
ncbi:MAG: hypothetical protein KAV87_51110 [Desulfobacteraceae bacterium]|nr:hypothetical protein [Desulfobacteraceae bacterium]